MTDVVRIEASTVDPQLTQGLAARVADPLWYLARQWQVGEFRGEDAASPVVVDATIELYPLTQILRGTPKTPAITDYVAGHGPIEPLVEAERAQDCLMPWDHMQASLRLHDRLAEEGLDLTASLGRLYPIPAGWRRSSADDRLGQKRLALLALRAFDPRALIVALLDPGTNPDDLPLLSDVAAPRRPAAVRALLRWARGEAAFAVTAPEGAPATWNARRQTYGFSLATGDQKAAQSQIILSAPDHTGGRLDWDSFDLARSPNTGAGARRVSLRGLVSPLRFPGQPAARFWELEEGQVYFGDLQAGAADLSRAVLGAFAAVAGDDWFVMPARLPKGHMARVVRMRLRDNFDPDWHEIDAISVVDGQNGGPRVWRGFEHRADEAAAKAPPLLLLAPLIASAERSAPVEDVHFRRDEISNLAWAIEKRSLRSSARVIEAAYPAQPRPISPITEGDWLFQLGSDVPDHWFPLVPVQLTNAAGEIVLRRGRVRDGLSTPPPSAKGRVLTPEQPFYIEEAEVPHGGARVTRAWRFARGGDGSCHLWMGRRKEPSTGPMALSPLAFDLLQGWPPRQRGTGGTTG